ncbi:50S ribosomal protein L11 methyltransferase [Aerococcus viridans]|uniref:50S ribosomal protein L11 methyltransferase n=1 Tax=Aerococcus viridans TaxID=1377 RepID=UPI002DB76B3E|nr:50S ribosomal protein L11 methyltransferase [Aerococcus viridans]MEB7388522.1 50S ribosomal protein L11 methyltransferase [Aerococcus viridans]
MTWYELIIETDNKSENLLTEILWGLDSAGVSIKDEQDYIDWSDDGFGSVKNDQPAPGSYEVNPVVLGYFSDDKNIEDIISEIKTYQANYNKELTADQQIVIHDIRYSPLEDKDWETAWQAYYEPIHVSRFMDIVPIWEKDDQVADPKKTTLFLDPGMAFGTGSHETTKLALRLLEIAMTGGEDVIDVGTGSGVLAIAAKKLGANDVAAYDFDGSILDITRNNFALNDVEDVISVAQNNILNDIDTQVDIITANILFEILEPLIPQAYSNLKPDGQLVLSGIFHDKKDDMLSLLAANDFTVEIVMNMGEWYGILAHKGQD